MSDLSINLSTHLRTREEIDELFTEIKAQGQVIDNEMDYAIRMAIQKVKLQLYYEEKLVEYKSLVKATGNRESTKIQPNIIPKAKAKKKTKRKKQTSLEKHDAWVKEHTKEEIIAINKARVAKFHPEPDYSTCSKTINQSRKKIEHEKEMRERTKGHWVSIVSVPMGGINKR